MYSVYLNSIKLWEHWQKEKEIWILFFLFTISYAIFLPCRDAVVLKQQHGFIHTPCKGYTLYLVSNCSKSPAQFENGSFAFVTRDNTSLT